MAETLNFQESNNFPKASNGIIKPPEYQSPFNIETVIPDDLRQDLEKIWFILKMGPYNQSMQMIPRPWYKGFLNWESIDSLNVTKATKGISLWNQSITDWSLLFNFSTDSWNKEVRFLSPAKQNELNQVKDMQKALDGSLRSVWLQNNSISFVWLEPVYKISTQWTPFESRSATYTQYDRSWNQITSIPSKFLFIDVNSRVSTQVIPWWMRVIVDDTKTGGKTVWETNPTWGMNQNLQQQRPLDTRPQNPELSVNSVLQDVAASLKDTVNMTRNFDTLVGNWDSLGTKDKKYFLDNVIGPRMTIIWWKVIDVKPTLDGKSLLVDIVPLYDVTWKIPPKRILINKFNYWTFN